MQKCVDSPAPSSVQLKATLKERLSGAGLVLAGGKSTRMGQQNKALLSIGNQSLLKHTVFNLEHQLQRVFVASGPHDYTIANTQLHDSGNCGPLEGIATGLQYALTLGYEWLVSSPCDTPNLTATWAHQLVNTLADGCAGYVYCHGRPHYAHALWPTRTLPTLQTAINSHRYSLRGALEACNAVAIDLTAIVPDNAFDNINSPPDWSNYQRESKAQSPSND